MTSAYSSSKLGLMLDRRRRIAGSMIGKRRDVLDRLTVLAISSDPYRQEPRRIEGEWFARWFNELCPESLHLRGFHYLLVTHEVAMPEGSRVLWRPKTAN
jgi:hypothetical protein